MRPLNSVERRPGNLLSTFNLGLIQCNAATVKSPKWSLSEVLVCQKYKGHYLYTACIYPLTSIFSRELVYYFSQQYIIVKQRSTVNSPQMVAISWLGIEFGRAKALLDPILNHNKLSHTKPYYKQYTIRYQAIILSRAIPYHTKLDRTIPDVTKP